METKYHRYGCLPVFLARIFGDICLIFGLLMLAGFLRNLLETLYGLIGGPKTVPSEFLFQGGFLTVFFLFLGTISSHAFPDLAVNDKGLLVQFYFKRLFVPWQDVVSFRESFISTLLPLPWATKHYCVLVRRRLTIFHGIVSLGELIGWGTGFLVSKKIEDFHDLARVLRSHTDPNYSIDFGDTHIG